MAGVRKRAPSASTSKRVMVTGSRGYLGSVVVPELQGRGYDVVGIDAAWFEAWALEKLPEHPWCQRDLRTMDADQLRGVGAVVHLAGLSNDPLGEIDPELTMQINARATVKLARQSRSAGVRVFVFASSCSVYGASGSTWATEDTPTHPLTAYARSKWLAERALLELATESFAPVVLRFATVFGFSPSMRLDLVANNLTAWAVTHGEVRLESDGTAWRPLIHIDDVARAIVAVVDAYTQRQDGDNRGGAVFNVSSVGYNLTVRELAEAVSRAVPRTVVRFGAHPLSDSRSYRVRCEKFEQCFPGVLRQRQLDADLATLAEVLGQRGVCAEHMTGEIYSRLRQLRHLRDAGLLDRTLQWQAGAVERERKGRRGGSKD